MDYSLPGSSVPRIFQARVLEWGAIAFPRPHLERSLITYTKTPFQIKSQSQWLEVRMWTHLFRGHNSTHLNCLSSHCWHLVAPWDQSLFLLPSISPSSHPFLQHLLRSGHVTMRKGTEATWGPCWEYAVVGLTSFSLPPHHLLVWLWCFNSTLWAASSNTFSSRGTCAYPTLCPSSSSDTQELTAHC